MTKKSLTWFNIIGMDRKILISFIIFCFAVTEVSAHNVVYYNISGKPVNSVGKPSTTKKATNVVKYNISGKPVSTVGKSLTYSPVNTVKYTISGKPLSSVGQPMTSTTTASAKSVQIVRGRPKPSRMIVNRCTGITYYKDGVPSCSR